MVKNLVAPKQCEQYHNSQWHDTFLRFLSEQGMREIAGNDPYTKNFTKRNAGSGLTCTFKEFSTEYRCSLRITGEDSHIEELAQGIERAFTLLYNPFAFSYGTEYSDYVRTFKRFKDGELVPRDSTMNPQRHKLIIPAEEIGRAIESIPALYKKGDDGIYSFTHKSTPGLKYFFRFQEKDNLFGLLMWIVTSDGREHTLQSFVGVGAKMRGFGSGTESTSPEAVVSVCSLAINALVKAVGKHPEIKEINGPTARITPQTSYSVSRNIAPTYKPPTTEDTNKSAYTKIAIELPTVTTRPQNSKVAEALKDDGKKIEDRFSKDNIPEEDSAFDFEAFMAKYARKGE